jgi:hypothetical protein
MVLMMLGIPINFELLKLILRARNIVIGAICAAVMSYKNFEHLSDNIHDF